MKKLFFILPLLLFASAIFAQSQDPSSKRILGNWFSDTHRTTKWVFTQDGRVYNYDKDIMKVMYKYTISHSCQNNSDDTTEYITLMDRDGDQYCFKINGINENKNGILSLINMSTMQPLIFVNDVNLRTQ
ncbi:hypothetical protein [Flavobacterium daemonense]|uniref:hypothetical protein n=1 Tax=Flavobacterium daemonense TaxID=1393049 RepID=UPI001184BF64|nr:hypothetical protein [Flavobacterium daemonense]KAF2333712.1 hypothetical protein FND99_09570 [Flavobacterium daemonense]